MPLGLLSRKFLDCTESLYIFSVTNQTSRPYKTPSRHVPTRPLSIFTIVFPVKSQEAFSSKSMSNIRHLLDS